MPNEQTEQAAPAALRIDNLLVHADSLANKEVTIEGICTHTCKHGATKIFLMGSDDTKTIRLEAGPLGSFDTKCINAIVTVTGTLKEQRVDEAYLQNWEAKLKAQTEKSHGETAAGCESACTSRLSMLNAAGAACSVFSDWLCLLLFPQEVVVTKAAIKVAATINLIFIC